MARHVAVRTGADLGVAVAEARAARGLTQSELAKAAGLDRTYLARMESGLSVQLLDRALRVLRRLGAEVTVTLPDAGADRARP
jgi:transcriptional regulator with XRE-family HTH domain